MIRLAGAILVIFATSYAGFECGGRIQKRINQLYGLKSIFTELYSDVEYGACTLSESFRKIAEHQEKLYEVFLKELSRSMKCDSEDRRYQEQSFAHLFSEAVDQKLSQSALSKEDKQGLLQFGKQLGCNQKQGQLRLIQMYLQKLELKIQELEKTKTEKQKIIRVLGISVGMLLVILLL